MRQYIEHLYFKRFGKEHPDVVVSIEKKIRLDGAKKARKREVKLKVRQAGPVNERRGLKSK